MFTAAAVRGCGCPHQPASHRGVCGGPILNWDSLPKGGRCIEAERNPHLSAQPAMRLDVARRLLRARACSGPASVPVWPGGREICRPVRAAKRP
jgi:hypothetical protein